ncbi:hypothetical protein [Rhodococcus sp. NJ-530]|uniref:hypothetical protein n=1 Tax=Rhodococcus sp. NJ-530 TaxID=2490853 RepID=UPI0019CF9B2B|nr:hypothetical protein [Rhodococcus sp. NJ-530]
MVVLRPEPCPQPVSDLLVQVVLLGDVAGVPQTCAVDVRWNRGPRRLKFELVLTGRAFLKRCENAGDDVVDQWAVLVVVVTVPVRVVGGRSRAGARFAGGTPPGSAAGQVFGAP